MKNNLLNYASAFSFILLMVLMSVLFQDREIVLPEIVAMAVALWVYKMPEWLQQPEKIFIVPTITALIGFAINLLAIPYLAKIGLMLLAVVLVMRLMKYAFPPALATGFLPIVTNASEWSFMITIIITTAILAMGVVIFRFNKGIARVSSFDSSKLYAYLGITALWMGMAYLLNIEHFAIIPPITVVLYESLKMKHYSLKIAVKQTVVLTLSITIAVILYFLVAHWIVLTLIYLVAIYFLLTAFNMKIPATYAFPFLVFVFPEQSIVYLPLGSFIVATFSFGMILLFNQAIGLKITN